MEMLNIIIKKGQKSKKDDKDKKVIDKIDAHFTFFLNFIYKIQTKYKQY